MKWRFTCWLRTAKDIRAAPNVYPTIQRHVLRANLSDYPESSSAISRNVKTIPPKERDLPQLGGAPRASVLARTDASDAAAEPTAGWPHGNTAHVLRSVRSARLE